MSLRKEKAARLKIQVLDHTLKLIGKKAMRPRADANVLDAEYTVVKKSPISITR